MKKGIAQGAMVLSLGGIIVKVIGALFKIPLGALLGPEGNGIFSIAYNIYALLFVIATAGIPVAMSKTVAEAGAKGQDVRCLLKRALPAVSAVGFALSLVLFFGADFFAGAIGANSAGGAIRVIAPAIFFVSISALFRGYFQGLGDMLPTAVSEIIEAVSKLVFGLICVLLLLKSGREAPRLAAGAVVGITLGAAFSAAYLLLKRKGETPGTAPEDKIVARLFKTALPITLGATVVSLSNVIDSGLIVNLLTKSGVGAEKAIWLFGAYNYSATVFNLPSVLVTTLGISLIPALTRAKVVGEYSRLSKTVCVALKLAVAVSAAAAGGLFVLGTPVINLLYSGAGRAAVEISGKMLTLLSLAIPALTMSSLTGSVLQAMGDVRTPMYSVAIGAVAKVFFNFLLIGRPQIGIYGACISTLICYTVICGLNILALCKKREISLPFAGILFAPLLSGVITGAGAKWIFGTFEPILGTNATLIPAILCGVLLWVVCIMLFRITTKCDIKLLFVQK